MFYKKNCMYKAKKQYDMKDLQPDQGHEYMK